jgi:cell division protein FtsQ
MRRVTAPPPRRPRRTGGTRVRRGLLWVSLPIVAAGALYGIARNRDWHDWRAAAAGAARLETVMLKSSAALGLTVQDIEVEGRQTTDPATILAALRAKEGTPTLAVNPARAKAELEALPWVRSAVIERRLPGTIYVRLVERKPLALWQHGGKIELIDQQGAVIPVDRLDRFAKLPLVVGEDAAGRAAALVAMLESEPELMAHVTAAIRVGGRRWNLRLDNSIDVLLPEDASQAAWAELARLDQSSAILKRNLLAIDMRLPDRLVLKLPPEPVKPAHPAKKGHSPAKST